VTPAGLPGEIRVRRTYRSPLNSRVPQLRKGCDVRGKGAGRQALYRENLCGVWSDFNFAPEDNTERSDGPIILYSRHPQAILNADQPDEQMASRGRVLLIEDDWLISSLVSDELVEQGYGVIGPAGSVAQALSFARVDRIDAALIDLSLGGQLPHEAIALLTQRGVPFVFMTAYTALPDGVDRATPVLQKPFTWAELFAALEGILPSRPSA
jgi:CheY-like chemotaxis protein